MPPAPLEVTRKPARRKAHPRSRRRAARAGALLVVSLVLNVAMLVGGGLLFTKWKSAEKRLPGETRTDDSRDARSSLTALGRIQPPGGVINIFGVPGERVDAVLVAVGKDVQAGDQLLKLSGATERAQALTVLTAQLAEAERGRAAALAARDAKLASLAAEVDQAAAKFDAETAALDAKVKGAQLQADRAAAELQRLQAVRAAGAPVADQDAQRAEALVAGARAELAALKEQRGKTDAQLNAAKLAAEANRKALVAETDRLLAQVPIESLKAGIAAAEQKITDAVVKAPVAGRVVQAGVQRGDTLSNLPAIQLAPAGNMTVVAEVYETDIAALRGWLNGGRTVTVEVRAEALGAPLKGEVKPDGIAPMIARNAVFALGPREDADRRVVEVTVVLDEASSKRAGDYIGLQVTATFDAPK